MSTRIRLESLACAALTASAAAQPAASFRRECWIADNPAAAMAIGGQTLYLGEVFHIGPHAGTFALVDPDTGELDVTLPKVNGEVRCAIPDGAGGWFIGGEFDLIDGVERRSIAHIDATGAVTAWNPGGGGLVRVLLLSGSTLYAAGHGLDLTDDDRTDIDDLLVIIERLGADGGVGQGDLARLIHVLAP